MGSFDGRWTDLLDRWTGELNWCYAALDCLQVLEGWFSCRWWEQLMAPEHKLSSNTFQVQMRLGSCDSATSVWRGVNQSSHWFAPGHRSPPPSNVYIWYELRSNLNLNLYILGNVFLKHYNIEKAHILITKIVINNKSKRSFKSKFERDYTALLKVLRNALRFVVSARFNACWPSVLTLVR